MVIGEETSSVAFMAQAYGEVWYWENRYAQDPVAFDWYQKYPFLAPVIHLYIPRSQPILVVGCGNSGIVACGFAILICVYRDLDDSLLVDMLLRFYRDLDS
ncbi:hypothetical protein M569_05441, partial [Genlisea aurea]